MSTFVGEEKSHLLKSPEDLRFYFHAFIKKNSCLRVGLEAEFFAVNRLSGRALPYEGSQGIRAILKELARRYHYSPILEEGNVIGLKKNAAMIALEPGGQIELSAPPVENVFEIESQIQNFLGELHSLADQFQDTAWLAYGIQPFSGLDEISWVPKKRYEIMAEYFMKHGKLSHHMMKRTASNQVNLDYLSEENAMQNFRTAVGISSIATAIFSNSSFSSGRPNGFMTRRLQIWHETDSCRSGLPIEFTRPDRSFQDYLNYILDMPMIFVVRQGKWIPFQGITFRQFIEKGYEGLTATLGDFELHLSTAFPEVRLKQYIEVRGMDCQHPSLIPAVAAFWKGLLYTPEASRAAWEMVAFASEAERLELHHAVAREGLHARLAGRQILPIAKDLVQLSCSSLAKQVKKDEKRDECFFLERLRKKIICPGKSPAEVLLEKWDGEWRKDPLHLIEYLSV